MPTLKLRVRPRTLAELRQERDLAEEWLRDAIEDYVASPSKEDAEQIKDDYLPRYRRAHLHLRAKERRTLKEAKP